MTGRNGWGMMIVALCAMVWCLAAATASAEWIETAKLNAGDGLAGDAFGYALALDGGIALIGAQQDDVDGKADQGSAYVFTGGGASWTQSQKLTASDGAAGDKFGNSAALDGDWAAIGAAYKGTPDAGGAYMFKNVGGTWTETQILTQAGSSLLGISSVLEGTRAAIGSYGDTVYVYDYNGSTWALTQALNTPTAANYFGSAVDVKGDRMVIGARNDDEAATNAGAVYVYEYDGAAWTQDVKLMAGDALASSFLGASVSLDGNLLAASAYRDGTMGSSAGAVYLFEDDGAGNWSQVAKLIGSGVDAGDYFGQDVLLQGDTLLVGAYLDEVGGTVYNFKKIGGTWTEVAKIVASDAAASDYFGVSLDCDGGALLVGANGDDDKGSNSGSAYVFVPEPAAASLLGLGGLVVLTMLLSRSRKDRI